jgi:hypothetical protein
MLTQAEVTAYVEEAWQTDDSPDAHPEQWERRRLRWASHHGDQTPHVVETCQAYEEATGSWLGCD